MKEDKALFNNISVVTYNNESFVLSKFSGFKKVDFNIELLEHKWFVITYFIELYFSGQILKIKKAVDVPLYDDKEEKFLGIFKMPKKEAKFIIGDNFIDKFEDSGYKSGKDEYIVTDFIRWFAEQTKTNSVLEEFEKEIKNIFIAINKELEK